MLSLPPELIERQVLGAFFPHADATLPRHLTIGVECATRPSYSWRGMERPGGPCCLFQYTLAGRGVLEREGVRHVLMPGQAFLVEIPDAHHYYLPAGWEPWQFLFLLFDGVDAQHHVHWVIEQQGPVLTLPEAHPALDLATELAGVLAHQALADPETLAVWLYRFTMALRRVVPLPAARPRPAIMRAMQYAYRHYAGEIGVDEMAQAAGLSRAHFSRIFHQQVSISPQEYLTRIRVQHVANLLRGTALSLESIAQQCGFSNAGYLGKVFRKVFGITPMAYRQGDAPTKHELLLP